MQILLFFYFCDTDTKKSRNTWKSNIRSNVKQPLIWPSFTLKRKTQHFHSYINWWNTTYKKHWTVPLRRKSFLCLFVRGSSRSAGGQLSSSGLHDNRTNSSQFGGRPLFSKPGGERDRDREHRERLAQSSRLFCRPEHRGDIWNRQRRRSTGYEA